MAIRSLLETIACQHIIQRRNYLKQDESLLRQLDASGQTLARKLQAMRKKIQTMDDRP
jgi:hypothetical protein